MFILLPQRFEPLLLSPLLLQLFLLLPELKGKTRRETKGRTYVNGARYEINKKQERWTDRWKKDSHLPSTDASVARAARQVVVLALDIVAGEFVVEADDAVAAERKGERGKKKKKNFFFRTKIRNED